MPADYPAVPLKTARNPIFTYTLLPGSTITPVSGATPTGPTEPLTGTFQWGPPDAQPSLFAYNAVSLSFSSQSFLITLDNSPLNNYQTSVFTNSSTTYFSEVVDLVGLGITPARLESEVAGSYTGPASAPATLNYPSMRIFPYSGGYYEADVTIIAQLVPEPSSFALIGVGVLTLAGNALFRRRKRDEPNAS
jgi:hypothetical protein